MDFLALPSEALLLLARLVAVLSAWFLLPDQYQEAVTRKLVLCAGLWHLSTRKSSTAKTPLKSSLTKSITKPCRTRQVSFGQMEILEFPTILGDNPSVKAGVPLSFDWKPVRVSTKQVDLVPDKRGPRRSPRALTPSEREVLLLSKGYTLLEIAHASKPPPREGSSPYRSWKRKVRRIYRKASN